VVLVFEIDISADTNTTALETEIKKEIGIAAGVSEEEAMRSVLIFSITVGSVAADSEIYNGLFHTPDSQLYDLIRGNVTANATEMPMFAQVVPQPAFIIPNMPPPSAPPFMPPPPPLLPPLPPPPLSPDSDDDSLALLFLLLLLLLLPVFFAIYVVVTYRGHARLYFKWRFSHSNPHFMCFYVPAERRTEMAERLFAPSAQKGKAGEAGTYQPPDAKAPPDSSALGAEEVSIGFASDEYASNYSPRGGVAAQQDYKDHSQCGVSIEPSYSMDTPSRSELGAQIPLVGGASASSERPRGRRPSFPATSLSSVGLGSGALQRVRAVKSEVVPDDELELDMSEVAARPLAAPAATGRRFDVGMSEPTTPPPAPPPAHSAVQYRI